MCTLSNCDGGTRASFGAVHLGSWAVGHWYGADFGSRLNEREPQHAARLSAADHCEAVFDASGNQLRYAPTGLLLRPSWDNVEPRLNDFEDIHGRQLS